MRGLKTIGSLLVVFMLALSLAGPAAANGGSWGGDTSGKGDVTGGKDNGGKDNGGKDNGGKDNGGDDNGGEDTGSTDPSTDPGTPSTTNEGGGNRVVDNPSSGHKRDVCARPDPRVLSSQGSLVGHVFKVDCRKDGTVLYRVNLVPPFDSEARRVIFKSDVPPCACYPVRLKLNDREVKKLIWMNAKH